MPDNFPAFSGQSQMPPSLFECLNTEVDGDGESTVLRKEEAMSLVMSALQVMRVGKLEAEVLRSYAKRILTLQGKSRYRYENSIDEIVEDLVWMME